MVKPAARVARRAALHLDQHRVLVDRVVPHKLVAQVVPAHRVADPAVLRAVAPAVLVDKDSTQAPLVLGTLVGLAAAVGVALLAALADHRFIQMIFTSYYTTGEVTSGRRV